MANQSPSLMIILCLILAALLGSARAEDTPAAAPLAAPDLAPAEAAAAPSPMEAPVAAPEAMTPVEAPAEAPAPATDAPAASPEAPAASPADAPAPSVASVAGLAQRTGPPASAPPLTTVLIALHGLPHIHVRWFTLLTMSAHQAAKPGVPIKEVVGVQGTTAVSEQTPEEAEHMHSSMENLCLATIKLLSEALAVQSCGLDAWNEVSCAFLSLARRGNRV